MNGMKYASQKAQNGRKHNNKCENCGKICCSEHLYKYTDDTNASINYNSPYLCKKCYEKKYNLKMKTEREIILKTILEDYYWIKNNIEDFNFNDPDKFYKFIQKIINEK